MAKSVNKTQKTDVDPIDFIAAVEHDVRRADALRLVEIMREYYEDDQLIEVQDELPQTKSVAGTDRALLSAHHDERAGAAILFCAIDNLGKGAAGQAVQGFNQVFGFEEAAGLLLAGAWP